MPNIEFTDVDLDFLRELYRLNFTQGLSHLSYREWCERHKVDGEACRRGYDRLVESGTAKAAALGMTMAITASGILHLEAVTHF